ncbi:protein lifeguard 3-like [Plodia interpunctella]|uniref:protein lifeguard 3-like n=1 Tax=Plodia interpunctella TaxID=58824 RepID=UPI002368A83E|nr:protein lifeguard 3-like [Plodia interpunctella]
MSDTDTVNKEEKIDVKPENFEPVSNVTDDAENIPKPEEGNDVELQQVKVENNVTIPVIKNEIGPYPRKPQHLWVQYIGPSPDSYGGDSFAYEPSRNQFVQLVFGLVLAMMIITAGYVLFCHLHEPVRKLYEDPGLGRMFVMVASAVLVGLSYAFACSGCTRTAPCSYFCLGVTVLAYGVICAYFTIKYETQAVFIALIATCIVVFVCLLLAFSNFDFTQFLLIIIVALVAFFAASVCAYLYMMITGQYLKPLHIVLLVIGTVLHSILLVVELQMVLGGRAVELSEDDYAYGAFTIYTSVVSIFLNLLQLMSMGDF